MSGDKVFVTGATGLLGSKITIKLIEKGYNVAGFTTSQKGKEKLESCGIKAYVGDILKAETVDAAISDFQPDIIINEITDLKNVDLGSNANVRIIGTKNLVDAALKYKVKKIQSQSIAFVYEGGFGPATEETPLDLNATGERKVNVDGVVGLEKETSRIENHVILRYGLLYGPGTWYGKDGLIYNQFKNGSVTMSDGVLSFIHLDDAVEAAIQALHFPPGIYNVADNEPVRGNEFANWYANLLDVHPLKLTIEKSKDYERGASNKKFLNHGGKLMYNSWREQRMHPME